MLDPVDRKMISGGMEDVAIYANQVADNTQSLDEKLDRIIELLETLTGEV